MDGPQKTSPELFLFAFKAVQTQVSSFKLNSGSESLSHFFELETRVHILDHCGRTKAGVALGIDSC